MFKNQYKQFLRYVINCQTSCSQLIKARRTYFSLFRNKILTKCSLKSTQKRVNETALNLNLKMYLHYPILGGRYRQKWVFFFFLFLKQLPTSFPEMLNRKEMRCELDHEFDILIYWVKYVGFFLMYYFNSQENASIDF